MTDQTCRTRTWWGGSAREMREAMRAPCLLNAPRVEMVPDRNRPGEMRSLTVRPMVLPDERCRHWRGREPTPEQEPAP